MPDQTTATRHPPSFLRAGGEMASRIAAHDWAGTLGPFSGWPQSLQTIVGFLLHSPVPMVLLWGQDGIMIYNDAYSVFAGGRHPQLLGSKVREGWPEVADFNDNIMKIGLAGGALTYRDQELLLNRSGTMEPGWMNLDYSPVIDESGGPGGVIAIVVETTERVLAERRQAEATARQRALFDQAPGFIIIMDGPEHVVEFVNETHRRVFGSDQWVGKTIREAFPSLEGQGFFEALDKVYATGEAVQFEGAAVRYQRTPGGPQETRYLNFVYAPVFGEGRTVSGIFCDGFDVTETFQAQRALWESEARLQQAADATGLGTFVWDTRSPGAQGDAHMRALFGVEGDGGSDAETPLADGIHPDDRAGHAAALARAIDPTGDGELREDIRILLPDGQIRWVAITGKTRFEAGRSVQMIGTAIDVTSAKLAEERLRESEARRQLALDAAAMGTFVWYPDEDRAEGDARMMGLFGLPGDGLLALRTTLAESIHEDDGPRYAAAVGRAIRDDGDGLLQEDIRVRLPGGEVRWLRITGKVQFEGGRAVRMAGAALDITESKQAEAALRELNANLERQVIERTQARGTTWQVTPDLMGALNSKGYFETSNPAWQSVLGWSEAEVASMSIFELLHPDDVERTRAGFALTQIGQPAIRFPNRYRCKDGDYRWISWVGVPEDGMVYCTGRDITEEKAAEAELALAQEALRQAQKMEAVGQLTGGLAHDFNNLLAGISGSLELLEKRLGEGRMGDAARYIGTAQSSTRRAAALTQRLLAFSRRQTLDPKPTDVNKLIAGMEELIRRSAGPTVQVEVVGAGGLWSTRIDPSQLENALLNLCLNGRDAMAPHGGRLTIETANKWLDERAARDQELPPGQYVSLCVSDTGSGMDAEVMARAFDPFFTTKPLGQGTGLGLSMIYGFVRQSGGQVRIYSEVGKGTTMCLYLPRHLGAEETQDSGEAVALAAPLGDGETVLVIDDEPTVRMLIVEVLEENGYSAIEVGDGPAGLKVLQSDARIDLLITDVGLPGGLNGRQVADAARLTRPNLKVLFITGYAENAAVGNGHLDPGMEVITKPFSMAGLGAKIRDLIDS